MNCKHVAGLLPEMAANELDETVRERALAHVHSCAKCSRELEAYRQAFAALDASRQQIAVPHELAMLRLPDERVSLPTRLRWAAAGAALAVAVLAISLVLPRAPRQTKTDVVKTPPRIEHFEQPAQAIAEDLKPPRQQAPPETQPRPPAERDRIVVVDRPVPPKPAPAPKAEDDSYTVIVVASRPEPTTISVRSVDEDGTVRTYSLVTDGSGSEHVTENEYELDTKPNGGNEL